MRFFVAPSDVLSLLFLALLSALSLACIPSPAPWGKLLMTYAALAAIIVSHALIRARTSRNGKGSHYVHAALTVVTILIIFNSLGDLIAGLRTRTYDDVLIAVDYALFGVHPTVWMERMIHPVLTTILQFAYISYYFIPLSVGIVLIGKKRFEEFDETLFGIVLCFYLSYIGYLLVPAIGPRFTLQQLQTTDLQAVPFVRMIQDTLNGLERNKADAFPSGHTAVALMSLYYAWKKKEGKLFGILLPTASALIVSTIYLRYHYVIDVMAGMGLTAFTIVLAPGLRRVLARSSHEPGQERHHSA